MDAYRPDPDIERILKLVLPSLNAGFKSALEYMLERSKYFVSFQNFANMLLIKLEEQMRLPEGVKAKLLQELEDIYRKEVSRMPLNILARTQPGFYDFTEKDHRAIEYALRLHDFYLGKFFQGDRELRKRVLDWMSAYYLEQGNPIGRGQKGVKEFLRQFRSYIQPQTEWKARQIIDTSVNFLRNAGRIYTLQKARTSYYRWDAVNDRLTCRICRSMDGRVFRTEEAVRALDMLVSTQDPELIRDLKPFINTVQKGTSAGIPGKLPPIHPHCRCVVVAQTEEVEVKIPASVEPIGKDSPGQRELLKEYSSLTRAEINNRIRAHLGSEWARPPADATDKQILKYLGEFVQKHYHDHAQEVGVSSLEEYKNLAYDIIKKPDKVFVERRFGQDYFVFYRGNIKVVCSDANLSINSMYKEEVDRWIERVQKNFQSAIIRLI